MAYVLGFFAADGNMYIHKNGGRYLEFTSCDKELIEKLRKILKSNHKISKNSKLTSGKPAYRIQIGSRNLYNNLLKLGMTPSKSLTIKFPLIQSAYLNHFVRGYFDGDGCAYLKKNWAKDRNKDRWVFQTRFTSGSKKFLEQLHKTLKKMGVCKGGYLYDKNGRGFELVFSHHDGLALFRFMYDNVPAETYLERKYETFQKAIRVLHLGP